MLMKEPAESYHQHENRQRSKYYTISDPPLPTRMLNTPLPSFQVYSELMSAGYITTRACLWGLDTFKWDQQPSSLSSSTPSTTSSTKATTKTSTTSTTATSIQSEVPTISATTTSTTTTTATATAVTIATTGRPPSSIISSTQRKKQKLSFHPSGMKEVHF